MWYYKNRTKQRWERLYAKEEFESRTEKVMLREVKLRCKQHGFEFGIDESDIIIPEFCPILGCKITRIRKAREYGEKKIRIQTNPSVDRIDNSKGYVKGNVWVISTLANTMKHNATIEQLIKFSESILKIFKDGKNNDISINGNNMFKYFPTNHNESNGLQN